MPPSARASSSESPACPWPGPRRAAPRPRSHRPRRAPLPPRAPRLPPPRAGAGTGAYKDGTYSADGNYVSPNGTETVGVELTLAGGTVSDVKITQHPSNPNTKKFQGEFAGGIKSQIVGKKLDEIKVSKVAGSSLTSGGFNQAVAKIKSQAQ